jgi:mannose-6-phosphate isomerase-like protein (cupin superfamily)
MHSIQLPGGTGLTYVQVYNSQAPDGQRGGTPHIHLACTELYYVLRGRGAAEFVSAVDGFQRRDLAPGAVVYFSPGMIHRLISLDEPFEILVVMQNGGLPEHGDVAFTFPTEILANPARYRAVAAARDLDEATRRRDLAVEGFSMLVEQLQIDRDAGLRHLNTFYEHALQLIQPRVDAWPTLVENGAAAAVQMTQQHIAAIVAGDTHHLRQSCLAMLPGHTQALVRPAMCGHIRSYLTADGAAMLP